MGNNLRVGFLMILLTTLLLLIGRTFGGHTGMIGGFLMAAIMNFGTYWFSSSIVLRMVRAQPADEKVHYPYLKMVDNLASQAGIPTPKLYIVPDSSPNAFATGRNPENGIIALNQGIIALLNEKELEGVIAHEMGHIIHRDTLTSAIAATMAGAIMTIIDMARWASLFSSNRDDEERNPAGLFVASLFAPLAATLIQLAISRSREYEADKTAAMLTGSIRGLTNGLLKLDRGVRAFPGQVAPSQAHMYIVNPFSGVGGFLMNLFSSHPPIEKRVARLELLEQEMGLF